MKKKTFVLMVSTKFQKGHPKEGKPTNFEEQILEGKKIHTIRENFKYWNDKVFQINQGEAILSVRKWTGKPYRSKQEVIKEFDKIGIQKCTIDSCAEVVFLNGKGCVQDIEKNDGLSFEDFWNWFPYQKNDCAIIHFTDLIY